VGGLPEEQARVAFLETDGLYFLQQGVRNKWMRHWLTRNVGRCLARARLPFDWISDDHVYAGWLERYDAVVVPGAWCLPERTHRALVAYAEAGGKVIADEVMRAEIPGSFSALPARGYAMYAPELKANSDEIKLTIVDRE